MHPMAPNFMPKCPGVFQRLNSFAFNWYNFPAHTGVKIYTHQSLFGLTLFAWNDVTNRDGSFLLFILIYNIYLLANWFIVYIRPIYWFINLFTVLIITIIAPYHYHHRHHLHLRRHFGHCRHRHHESSWSRSSSTVIIIIIQHHHHHSYFKITSRWLWPLWSTWLSSW